jgi:hypothetical protein
MRPSSYFKAMIRYPRAAADFSDLTVAAGTAAAMAVPRGFAIEERHEGSASRPDIGGESVFEVGPWTDKR